MAIKHRTRTALRRWVFRVVTGLSLCGVCAWFYTLRHPEAHPIEDVEAYFLPPAAAQDGPADGQRAANSASAATERTPQGDVGKTDSSQPTASKGQQAQASEPNSAQIGMRKDATGSIPVALRGLSVAEWMRIEANNGPKAKRKLEKGSQPGAEQGPGGVFGAVDVAVPLSPPILQYPLNSGSGQAEKNIVGLKSLKSSAKEGRKCIVYGMGIAEESDFEQMMALSGCETHAFDCTVDYEAESVFKKKFNFHQWCIGDKPASSQSSGDNTYSSSATVRIEGKVSGEDNRDIALKVVSGGKGGGGNRADFYVDGKKIQFNVGRGMNVISLDPVSHEVLSKGTYDIFEKRDQDNRRLAEALNSLPEGRIVLMAVMDSGLENLLANAMDAMRALGASKLQGAFRESYGFIGRKGHGRVAESRSRDMPSKLIFKTLAETMKELGHTYLDLLKFDIEGFEWGLFASEILTQDREHLPEQISFELHTKEANPSYVPHDVVGSKGYKEVNKLMLDLYNVGYRITSKEVNNGDHACAEFVALNVV